ncbi:hypothetical protein GIB67_005397 [Kingdonia uniflora]|uniref:Allene oxide synthase n=1 Tax=Kingdonia uniflora TaxID=39325 RepID=A0A7J7NH73_9MAGN|nr:hypothetical protein GIB67_005397 [Kingdonia uniflora]
MTSYSSAAHATLHLRSLSKQTPRAISSSSISETPSIKLPIKKIPGDYGIPLISPLKDRLDYFYFQGRELYFKSRIQKHNSTVYRTNMPPGPFISSNPNVVVLLDGKSFPVLHDVTKVEKMNLFTGTYMPSTDLTGGFRVLSYLDPSEPKHAQLKQLLFFLLKSRRDHVIPEFHVSFTEMFEHLEAELAANGKADFSTPNDTASFGFLCRSFFGFNPVDTKLGLDGPGIISKWVLLQLGPVISLGLPWFIEDPLLHTFRLPAFIVKSDYKRLYDIFYENSDFVLDEGEKLGICKEETCHNLVFATCFNSFGGMKIFFPTLMKWIGRSGGSVQRKLAEEIRSVVRSNGGKVTMMGLEQMALTKSVVYEALRMDPPVPLQYGKAKRDIVIESHDTGFEIKKGEMLCGFQTLATRDSRIFEKGEEFVGDRFVGEKGEKLLEHVLWSNGPENGTTTLANKQCAGKDFVVMAARLLVVELFLRYDSIEIEVGTAQLGREFHSGVEEKILNPGKMAKTQCLKSFCLIEYADCWCCQGNGICHATQADCLKRC